MNELKWIIAQHKFLNIVYCTGKCDRGKEVEGFFLRVRVHVRAGEYLQVHVQLNNKDTVE